MDPEELWRATLHDFNNLLTGLQSVADLGDPALPFDPQNHERLETLLEDGKVLISMARTVALGRLPYTEPIPWKDWEAGLGKRLEAAGTLFHCPIDFVDAGAGQASWPAPLLQDWVVAFTRQILPWAAPGPLRLEAEAVPGTWILRWFTDSPLPPCLEAEWPREAPRSLAGLWLRGMADHMNLTVEATDGILRVRVPQSDPSTPAHKES